MRPKHWLMGKTIGKYKVKDPVGSGAMSWIYRASHPEHGQAVLKFLKLSDDESRHFEEQARFRSEARSLARIRHKNVVQVIETGIYEEVPFIVMPFLDGWDLAEVLKIQSRLPWEKAMYIGFEVAGGLAAIHKNGIIHRDIKPANIMVVKGGGISIVDLGIAKPLNVNITADGRLVATIAFSSPEQIQGRQLTPKTDLFSFGVLTYQLITGKHPFLGATSAATIYNILEFTPPKLKEIAPDIPDEVSEFVHSLMAKNPDHRPADAALVAETCLRLRKGAGYGEATRVDLVLDDVTALAAEVFAGKYPFMLLRRDLLESQSWSVEASLAPFVCAPKKSNLKRMKFSMGRTDDNEVVIPLKTCSRHHAFIFQGLEGEFIVEDNKSTNGTFLNGARVEGPQHLNNGDVLHFGADPPYIFLTADSLKAMDLSVLGNAMRRSQVQ